MTDPDQKRDESAGDEETTETAPDTIELERNTIFVLAGLLLAALVSIALFNLDSHPAFPRPSDEFVEAIDGLDAPIIFADDPVALAALEDRQDQIEPAIRPLQGWPPEGPLLIFGTIRHDLAAANLELIADHSVWTLWKPADFSPLPFFGAATVEVVKPDGPRRLCEPSAGGHQCGDASWTRVRLRTLTVDGQQQRCIWAHPIEDRTIRITFPPVVTETDDGRRLWLQTALRDAAVGGGGYIDFQVHLGDDQIRHRHHDRRGWQSTRLPASTEPAELSVEISAPRVGRRHSCFDFELR